VLDGLDETVGGGLAVLAEEIGSLDRCQRAAGSEIPVGDVAVIAPYGDEPWHVGPAQPDLVDGQDEFFVLAALAARCAVLREAGDERQRVVTAPRLQGTRSCLPALLWQRQYHMGACA
jgi:hypothetical protein